MGGVVYPAFLGGQAMHSAIAGQYTPLGDRVTVVALGGWRQGLVCKITHPKALVFDLAILPRFLTPRAGVGWLAPFALSHAALGFIDLVVVTFAVQSVRSHSLRRRTRPTLDGAPGFVLLAFSARLVAEHA